LLDEMATAMLQESVAGLDPITPFAGTWRDFAVRYASGLRRMLLCHGDGRQGVLGHLSNRSHASRPGAAQVPGVLTTDPTRINAICSSVGGGPLPLRPNVPAAATYLLTVSGALVE
jgi:hypothetical protein